MVLPMARRSAFSARIKRATTAFFTIANVTTNTFDITVAGSPVTPATGQIYITAADNKHFGYDLVLSGIRRRKIARAYQPQPGQQQRTKLGIKRPRNGTPGAANSIVASNIAPFIENLSQCPYRPQVDRSSEHHRQDR